MRTIAMTTLSVGTVGSLYFMLNAGSNQKSILLLVLFTAWVLSPFVGLFIANNIFTRWTVTARQLIFWLILFLTIVSLFAYSGTLIPPETKPAFIFLVIPLASWFLIITIFLIARQISKRVSDTNKT